MVVGTKRLLPMRSWPAVAVASAVLCVALVSGCAGPAPEPAPAVPAARAQPAAQSPASSARGLRLTPAQLALLRSEGFRQTDDGWEFGLNVRILFDFDDDRLREEARVAVVRVGRKLLSVQIEKIRVEGHTDNTGSRDYNEQLSRRRAAAVAQALVAAGFEVADVEVLGLGAARPIADNGTATGRAENRRVAIVVPVPKD